MFAQCPDCGKTYPVTKKQQRARKSQIFCKDCDKKFTVKAILAEIAEKPSKTKQTKNKEKPKSQAIQANENNIVPVLHTVVESKYISKNKAPQLANLKIKPEYQPYLNCIEIALKKSDVESAVVVPQAPPAVEPLPWESKARQLNINWFLGSSIALILLLGQAVYFEAPKASQDAKYRPLLEKVCHWFGCKIKDYSNLSELNVLQGSFTTQADHTIVFKTAINNQAPFKQKLPNIQLNLLNYNDELVAQRIFYPQEYLTNSGHTGFMITPDETVEAKLHLAVPETPIGEYNFNLVY